MPRNTIHVRAYERRKPGKRVPKWILYHFTEHAVLVDLRRWSFAKDLGAAKVYFRNQLKRRAKDLYGDDWQDKVIMLAVR